MEEFIKAGNKAAVSSAEILMHYFNNGFEISKKGIVDIVTQADKESEDNIITIIKKNFKDHGILGEETGWNNEQSSYTWIIDPLDGTTNFAAGLPVFSISIALYKEKKPLFGIVHDPVKNHTYLGIKGKGSFLNDEKISVSNEVSIEDTLIATGFPYNFKEILPELKNRFFSVLNHVRGVRRLGSAALDLCYLSCGVFDGFFEQNLKPWDTAAGIIIAEEAGAKITDFSGNEFNPFSSEILATNSLIHEKMVSILEL